MKFVCNRLLYFLLTLVSCMHVTAAHADLDQRCLALCKSGHSSTQCLAECSYDVSTPSIGTSQANNVKSSSPESAAHNVFKAPVPSNDIIAKAKPSGESAGKDYRCATECMKNGGQYKLCNDRCARLTCATGSATCKDLRGTAPDFMLSNPPPSTSSKSAVPSK